jgi:molybdate transport system substrate-binding protein
MAPGTAGSAVLLRLPRTIDLAHPQLAEQKMANRHTIFHTVALALISAFSMLSAPASAAELTVYSGGAVQSGLSEAAKLYEQKRGVKIELNFMPMGPLTQRLSEGLVSDILVLTEERMATAIKSSIVDKDSRIDVGRVAMGVAVNAKASVPDISTPEAFKQALLAAKSIVYIDPARGTSGAHVVKVLERLGITDAVKGKTTLGTGGYVVAPVGRGEIELGIHQITEILPVEGIKLAGPLPPGLQNETLYQGAVMSASGRKAEAGDFLAFVRSPEIRQVFIAKGFVEQP